MRPELRVERLRAAGFKPIGEWTIADGLLRCSADVPPRRGVYAFSIDGCVMYVGLAATSLAKRLYFYARPAATQSTNLRLNSQMLIALASKRVQIDVSELPDLVWNGLPVSGPQGLEAGLIAAYDLPWNQKGGTRQNTKGSQSLIDMSKGGSLLGSLVERVLQATASRPGLTEAELARVLFGDSGYQQKVNPVCRALVKSGRLRRLGLGGVNDPYTYVLASTMP